MLMSSLYNYIDVFILVSGTTTIKGSADDAAARNVDKKKIKNWYLKIVHYLLTA